MVWIYNWLTQIIIMSFLIKILSKYVLNFIVFYFEHQIIQFIKLIIRKVNGSRKRTDQHYCCRSCEVNSSKKIKRKLIHGGLNSLWFINYNYKYFYYNNFLMNISFTELCNNRPFYFNKWAKYYFKFTLDGSNIETEAP